MGKHGTGQRNESGKLILNSTLFLHNRHKVFWRTPDHRTHIQVDHIAISEQWKKDLLDIRSKSGADVTKDHYSLRWRE